MFEKPESTYRELEDKLAFLADEVQRLRDQRHRRERWHDMRDQARVKWTEAREMAGQRAHEADEFVHRNPWQAVSVALVAGVLLGLFSGKSHHRRGR